MPAVEFSFFVRVYFEATGEPKETFWEFGPNGETVATRVEARLRPGVNGPGGENLFFVLERKTEGFAVRRPGPPGPP